MSVFGTSTCSHELYNDSVFIGNQLAANNYIIICGELSGVMQGIAEGTKQKNGLTIGINPDYYEPHINKYIDIVINTGMGHARNSIIAASLDIILAIGG